MRQILISAVVAILVAAGVGLFLSGSSAEPTVGAAGQTHTSAEFFPGGITVGSNCYSTTTTGTVAASTLENNSCLVVAAAGAGQAVLALTLPATSTLTNVLPDKGSCRAWFIDTTGVAAATTTTITAGTGWNLVGLDATGAGTGADVIDGNEYGRLIACRETDSDIVGYITEWIHAD
jgi:hypothetical protein